MIGDQIISHDLFEFVSNSRDLVIFVVVDSYWFDGQHLQIQ
jgi:hypothetical protein